MANLRLKKFRFPILLNVAVFENFELKIWNDECKISQLEFFFQAGSPHQKRMVNERSENCSPSKQLLHQDDSFRNVFLFSACFSFLHQVFPHCK